jgi:hypothetical protein
LEQELDDNLHQLKLESIGIVCSLSLGTLASTFSDRNMTYANLNKLEVGKLRYCSIRLWKETETPFRTGIRLVVHLNKLEQEKHGMQSVTLVNTEHLLGFRTGIRSVNLHQLELERLGLCSR